MADYVYHDRKMMKWMPFNALLEQGDYINDLLHGRERVDMPVLSPDQQAELNYQLETAVARNLNIDVMYHENYRFHHVTGAITRVDVYNKLLFIGDTPVPAQSIIEITLH